MRTERRLRERWRRGSRRRAPPPAAGRSTAPGPSPVSFVLTNGSNNRFCTSGARPGPSSCTWTTTAFVSCDGGRTSSRTVPPCGNASRALSSRFTSTCWIWLPSMFSSTRAVRQLGQTFHFLPAGTALDQRQGAAHHRQQVGAAAVRNAAGGRSPEKFGCTLPCAALHVR